MAASAAFTALGRCPEPSLTRASARFAVPTSGMRPKPSASLATSSRSLVERDASSTGHARAEREPRLADRFRDAKRFAGGGRCRLSAPLGEIETARVIAISASTRGFFVV